MHGINHFGGAESNDHDSDLCQRGALGSVQEIARRWSVAFALLLGGGVCPLSTETPACAESHNVAQEIPTDHVDLIEINHLYDEQCKRLLDQCIYYEWCPTAHRFQVRAWRLVKSKSQIPVLQSDGSYKATWHDGDVLRSVRSAGRRETWTQIDPEVEERAFLPQDNRRNFRKSSSTPRDPEKLLQEFEEKAGISRQ